MKVQNYVNHRRMHPLFHYIFTLLTLALVVLSIDQLVRALRADDQVLPAIMFVLIALIVVVILTIIRSYPLKAQDRAIRAEENLRHFVLTGKLLDKKLTMGQITALRFASDEEFPTLTQKAADERLDPDVIKKAIRSWRGDNFRI
ncbi:hypothetical protein A8709_09460 [Paenibacillus pectinilyticus]|uniref:Uncharacterized protein n=1 Tax=Paenibacillus pectinilyticus TaxID=512399 RepID=A0A1C1A5K7_9BACL|nr:DUF6526 family protein [Paenibacillus pectinilyticus]OCT15844.1 hypothetical protein A8709_09460 [Paenibacillus pectinilyticus]